MQLTEFIENVMKTYGMTHPVKDVQQFINNKARALAVGSVAVVDDDTVRDWIINYDPSEKEQKAREHATKQMEVAQRNKDIPKSEPHPMKKEQKQNEQISLFDF